MSDILKLIFTSIFFIAILYGAYYVTKLTGKFGYSKSMYMKIVDRLILAKDKSIAIVKVGEEHLLIGISSSGINILKKIDSDKLTENENSQAENDIVADFIKKGIRSAKDMIKGKKPLQFNEILMKKIKLGNNDEKN